MSSSISSVSSAVTSVLSSVTSKARASAAHASASASAAANPNEGLSYTSIGFITLTAIITAIAIIAASIYFTGNADDVAEWWAKRYYKAKALAEVKVLENTGIESVQNAAKDSLKKNPLMGEDELEQVSGGLGKEAAQQGLSGVGSKLGGLGKL